MYYRTKMYVAADWDNDIDAVNQLYKWNDSNRYADLSFVNVHDFVQARDTSLYCSIKKSLSERMKMCKTFILIVGNKTNTITKGSCQYCNCFDKCYYKGYTNCDSYIEHECNLAIKSGLNIVVLYNSEKINRSLCPEQVRFIGIHSPMKQNGLYCYQNVKNAIIDAEFFKIS
jgi:hypothetical protein